MRILKYLLPSLLVALVGAASPAAAQAPAAAKPASEGATAAVKKCGSLPEAKERQCYAAAIEVQLASDGPAAALQLLDRLAALDSDVRRDGHMYAHHIGIAALKTPAEVGRVFATCTPAYQSGCYHGVIQSYFLALERQGGAVTTETVDTVCADHRAAGNGFLLFQCTHGLGHGLTMLHRHDLPKGLASCDLLSRPAEQEMCWAGAFMENIVNATHPHPAAQTAGQAKGDPHAAHSGHGGHHGHSATPAAAPFRALDPADLHYPCSKMDEKYLVACYTLQTSAMLHHTGQDISRTAKECARAPEKARTTCFLSLGRDVSSIALGDNAKAARLCDLADATFRPACHRGVVESVINMNADPAEGVPYCRAVSGAESKRACYTAVSVHAPGLPNGEAKRDQGCKSADPEFLDACLGRPAGLVRSSGTS